MKVGRLPLFFRGAQLPLGVVQLRLEGTGVLGGLLLLAYRGGQAQLRLLPVLRHGAQLLLQGVHLAAQRVNPLGVLCVLGAATAGGVHLRLQRVQL